VGIARNLEKRLERLADGLSATLFRGRMHPVDLANRLVRQADLMVIETATGPSIPNFFSVAVNPDDMASDIDSSRIEAELGHTLDATATDRGWRIGGPVSVRITTDKSVGRGSIRCDASPVPAALPGWGELSEHRGERSFALFDNRVVVGRSSDADITLDDPEVSRHHAVLFRQGGRLWIADLGSSNGTAVNGHQLGSDAIEVGPSDMLSFGTATFALRIG
jgi:hypothetical protein